MSKRNSDDGIIGLLAIMIIAIFAMPLVGIYLLTKGGSAQKVLGVALTIIGLVLWFNFFG